METLVTISKYHTITFSWKFPRCLFTSLRSRFLTFVLFKLWSGSEAILDWKDKLCVYRKHKTRCFLFAMSSFSVLTLPLYFKTLSLSPSLLAHPESSLHSADAYCFILESSWELLVVTSNNFWYTPCLRRHMHKLTEAAKLLRVCWLLFWLHKNAFYFSPPKIPHGYINMAGNSVLKFSTKKAVLW